jgi:DNA-binding response OmpR family regulator
MPKILVVDDEPDIIDLAAMYLESEGFAVLRASDGVSALAQVSTERPDLVILDIMLPKMDGWEVCRRLRAESDIPVIMVTARGDAVDRVVGLELGADDYVVKPFNGRELVARVKAVLRRTSSENGEDRAPNEMRALTLGDVTIDPARRTVNVNGQSINMRAREFELLLHLLRNEGLVMSRDQLLDQVWGYDYLGDSRTVDVHVAHVRSHLQPSNRVRIDTVWSVGYKLMNESAGDSAGA